jgi:very-short-patch-repair endonuclease
MRPAQRPDRLRGRVFRGRDAVASGLLSKDALRSSAWRRLYQGVYADAGLPDSIDVRISGATLLMPTGAVFSGRTAAHLFAATELCDRSRPVEITVPPGVRFGPVKGLRIRSAPLPPSDVTMVARRRCTSEVRTALDLARLEDPVEAVVVIDVFLARRIVHEAELADAVARLEPGRGSRRARTAVSLADARAESPQESRLRVVLARAGMPAVPQVTIRRDDGTFVARVDLAYPEYRIAIEYDGVWHAESGQFARDRRRLNELASAGWIVIHVTAADLRDPPALIARIKALMSAREIGKIGL